MKKHKPKQAKGYGLKGRVAGTEILERSALNGMHTGAFRKSGFPYEMNTGLKEARETIY